MTAGRMNRREEKRAWKTKEENVTAEGGEEKVFGVYLKGLTEGGRPWEGM